MSSPKASRKGSKKSARKSASEQASLPFPDPRNDSRALRPLDTAVILREWRLRCAEVEAELRKVTAQSEEFHRDAVPGYRAWLAREFGAELSELRALGQKIAEAALLRDAIRAEAAASRISQRQAYQVVLARKKRGEDLFPAYSGNDDDWDEGWSEVDPWEDYSGSRHTNRKPLEEDEDTTADEEPTTEEREAPPRAKRSSSPMGESKPTEVDPLEARLKTLYRKLAFALHPDANPNLTERERRLWDEVQAAYQARDISRLELLAASLETGKEGWLDSVTQLSLLRTVFAEKTYELRVVRSEFHRLRKDAAWKYWLLRDSAVNLTPFKFETEEQLVREFLDLQRRLRAHEQQFELWRQPARETQSGASRNPRRFRF